MITLLIWNKIKLNYIVLSPIHNDQFWFVSILTKVDVMSDEMRSGQIPESDVTESDDQDGQRKEVKSVDANVGDQTFGQYAV